MYGTIARGKVRKDRVREFMALGKEWDTHERKRVIGYINSELLWAERSEGRFCLIVHFTNREAYLKNANSPEQDAFHQRLRACLDTDFEWTDGIFAQWDSPYAQPPSLD